MKEVISQVISLLDKKEFDKLYDRFETKSIYYHDTNNYKEIWVKPSHKEQDTKNVFGFYWYHLYKYIGEFDRKHLLFVHGRMGNTHELKIYI